MHIRSKFDGGKQINRCQSVSWQGRCASAALRVNEGPEWGPSCWTKVTQSQANKCFKSVSASKAKQVYNDRKRKATDDAKYKGKQKRKESDNSLQDHRDYSRYDNKGPNAREVSSDISNSNLHELMIKYYNAQVTVTEASAEEINMSTIEQGSN